jgi:hypothetical protein
MKHPSRFTYKGFIFEKREAWDHAWFALNIEYPCSITAIKHDGRLDCWDVEFTAPAYNLIAYTSNKSRTKALNAAFKKIRGLYHMRADEVARRMQNGSVQS